MNSPKAPESRPWLLLARILRPQGRKGEVLAELFTDFPTRFDDEPRVFLAPTGFSGDVSEVRGVQVVSFFLPVGRNLGRIVLQLDGIDSIEAAELLTGLEIIVPHQERIEIEDDANYISDLLGCTVYDVPVGFPPNETPVPDSAVGTVEDVHFPTAPDGLRRLEEAAPILVVLSPDGDEILIPFVKQFLITLNPQSRRILMTLPEGLIEINTPSRQPRPA